jgi:glycolate oxidase
MACSPEIIHELTQLLGPDLVLTAPEDLLVYAFDGTAALQQQPGCVVFARDTADIQAVLRLAQRTRTPVVTRGSGTGLSGGSLPVPGCIVLCTVRMNRILEVDRANLTLLTEPGATTVQIAEAAAAVGLFYPPDPGSMKISTIGGNVAENSGGLRGLKYGITRNYVMGLEVVLPDGEILFTGNKCVKDVAGYSLKDLFIGSEGTLGVITRILLRLIPQPSAKQTLEIGRAHV